MKSRFNICGILCFALLVWACGHSQNPLGDFSPSGPVQTEPTLSEPTLSKPIPSEEKPWLSSVNPITLKEFDAALPRLTAGAAYASPLTLHWLKTFTAQLSLTKLEIREFYNTGVFDPILRLGKEEEIDWHDYLPRVNVDRWFLTRCSFCQPLPGRFLGSGKDFWKITLDAPPAEVNGAGAHPSTAYDPVNKNYLIVWDEGDGKGGGDIYAKLVGDDGVTVKVDRTLISVPRPTQGCLFADFARQTGLTAPTDCKENTEPVAAYNDGRFLVTWTKRINAVKPAGGTMSVILGQMVSAATLETAGANWEEGILLSKVRYASTSADHPARNDDEVQAWSRNEHSAVAPFFGSEGGRGAFLLVWDTTRDFITCVDPARRGATSIYGRVIPHTFSPTSGNRDLFAIHTDPSAAGMRCAPNSDVNRARKPRVAYSKNLQNFLTVFEVSKNVASAVPSIGGVLVAVDENLNAGLSSPVAFDTIDSQMHKGCFDPDVVATAERFVVIDDVGHERLKLTEVAVQRGAIGLSASEIYIPPDGVRPGRPRVTINRVMGGEGNSSDFPLEYVAAYETGSEIQVASFGVTLAAIEPKLTLAAPGFPTNRHPALASAGLKVLAVWNAVKGSESRIFDTVVTVNEMPPVNQKPVALIEVVGDSAEIPEVTSGDVVTLSGESSRDPEGEALTYAWRQVSGPTIAFSSATAVRPTFTAPTVTTAQNVVIELRVTDARGLASDPARKTIRVKPRPVVNQPPTAQIEVVGHPTDPVEVASAEVVTLSGEASRDPEDGTNLTYTWSQTAGPTVRFSNTTASRPTFTAPTIPAGNQPQNITIQLVVRDTQGLASSPVQKTITVKPVPVVNQKPVARIDVVGHPTDPVEVASGATVTLSGENSTDDGSIAAYAWRQVSGPSVTLSSATASRTNFTAPTIPSGQPPQDIVIELVVTDNQGLASDPVSKTVTVLARPNTPPVAVIEVVGQENESPPVVTAGAMVVLSGARSSDPDGQVDLPLSYEWRQTPGSTPPIAIMNGTSVNPYFTVPTVSQPADISVDLRVTDARGLSSPYVSKTIRVNPPPNNPPRAQITVEGNTNVITTLTVDDSARDPVFDAEGNPSWPRTRVTLSGAASDNGENPAGPVSGHQWVQVGATAETAIETVSGENQSVFSFVVPDVTMAQGSVTVTIRLTVDDGGWSTNTASQDLAITVNWVNHRPTAPVLTGPVDGETWIPVRGLLDWQDSMDPDTADGDPLFYDVYLDTNNPPMILLPTCTAIGVSRCVLTDLTPQTAYFWKVRVRDSANEDLPALYSSIGQFSTTTVDIRARWKFDDGPDGLCDGDGESQRGIRACDSSDNQYHLVLGSVGGGSFPLWVQDRDVFLELPISNILNLGLGFNERTFAITPDFRLGNVTAGSIEFWFLPITVSPETVSTLFQKNNADAGGITGNHIRSFLVQHDGNSHRIIFTVNDLDSQDQNLVLASTNSVISGEWNHVVCSFGSGNLTIYINGSISSQMNVRDIHYGTFIGDTMLGWNSLSQGNLLPPEYVFGVFDEIVFYNEELGSGVIQELSSAH